MGMPSILRAQLASEFFFSSRHIRVWPALKAKAGQSLIASDKFVIGNQVKYSIHLNGRAMQLFTTMSCMIQFSQSRLSETSA